MSPIALLIALPPFQICAPTHILHTQLHMHRLSTSLAFLETAAQNHVSTVTGLVYSAVYSVCIRSWAGNTVYLVYLDTPTCVFNI